MRLSTLVVVLASACVDQPDHVDLGELESEVVANNKLSANKLSANQLSANKLSANKLSANSLANTQLVATESGREVLSYIVSCALPYGQRIVIGAYSFDGSIGLAPAWANRLPTVAERRWVTACLLARTNAFGITVELSLRGPHSALATSLGESVGYTLVEGAFYGDLFDPAGARLYACAAEVHDANLALSTQALRACATSSDGITTGCGFTYTGKCAVTDLSLAPACTGILPPYTNCRAGRTSTAPRFSEVITVYLKTGV